MSQYLLEFAGLMAVFSLVIVAPGADFAVVVRQAVVQGRGAAIWTSVGIGLSLLFHLSYTILGLGLIVAHSLLAFAVIKWAGAAYLVFLGLKSWHAPAFQLATADQTRRCAARPMAPWRSLALGFATNALNPKPVLFFLSLFSTLVSHETPMAVQAVYGLSMAGALIAWFVAVSVFFTVPAVRARFTAVGRLFNKVIGAAFIGLGLKLAAAEASR